MKTLYISDLDGTLLSSSAELSPFTVQTLNRLMAEGMYFTFATARTVYSAKPITSGLRVNVPCILNNGAEVYDMSTGEYVRNAYFKLETAEQIVRSFRENGVRCFVFKFVGDILTTCYDRLEAGNMTEYVEQRKAFGQRFLECPDVAEILDGRAVYINSTGSYEKLYPVSEAVRKIPGAGLAFYRDTYTEDWYLEIFSSEASKGNAVRFLCEKYGFDRVTAFGDNLNDLSLFEQADVKIAVGNAHEELKKAADIVIGTNDENGVAEYLKNILKGIS